MYEARCFMNMQLLIFRGLETSEVFEIMGMNNVEVMIINCQYKANSYHHLSSGEYAFITTFLYVFLVSNQGPILVLKQDCNTLL